MRGGETSPRPLLHAVPHEHHTAHGARADEQQVHAHSPAVAQITFIWRGGVGRVKNGAGWGGGEYSGMVAHDAPPYKKKMEHSSETEKKFRNSEKCCLTPICAQSSSNTWLNTHGL